MPSSTVTLRPALPSDQDRVFAWANDPLTRAASFRAAPISPQEHARWYTASLEGARLLYIAEADAHAIGLMRLDPIDGDVAEVGLTIANEFRGRRLSVPALRALAQVAVTAGFSSLLARIREDNQRSQHVFESAGFSCVRRAAVHGIPAREYTLQLSHCDAERE
jgi:RimJ/RimL family protein N-acetyltransferase